MINQEIQQAEEVFKNLLDTRSKLYSFDIVFGKYRDLCSSMVAILRDYMAVRAGSGSDYLFCNEVGDFLTENALRLAIVKYNNTRGVERTSIHAFRYTFARMYLVDCGGDAFSLQRLIRYDGESIC